MAGLGTGVNLGIGGVAALFFKLKLRLIIGNLRGETARQIGFVFSVLAAVAVAVIGFITMGLVRLAPPDMAVDLVVIAFTMFWVAWAIGPLMMFGLDDTLDPSRVALLPLTTGRLAAGMFTASVTGVWPPVTLIITSGALTGIAVGATGITTGIVAVVLLFALCIVTSRLVTTALSGALRSRRGRDLAAVSVVFVVLLSQLPNLVVNQGSALDVPRLIGDMAGVLRWTPAGMAGHAIGAGGLVALAELAAVALIVAVFGILWIAALKRALVTPDTSTQAAGVRSRSLAARVLPESAFTAVVVKELKYARRDPRGRVGWITAVAVSGVLLFSISGQGGGAAAGAWLVYFPACLSALMTALQSANAFGIDGRSLWMNAVVYGTARDLRTDLAGRHLALVVLAVPLITAVAIAGALLAGDWTFAWSAALTGWGVFGVGLAVGSVTTVLVPYTTPERLNSFSGAAPGQGGIAFLSSFGSLLVTALLALPIALPPLLGAAWWSLLAVPYGLTAAWAGRRLASALGLARMPEILAAVSRPS
ncbi:ABC-2 type transport system permease protein [Sinosporangium album]|uniref:ABC-2 type transport system permease protein n=1 Tax=Sinosporangium album TaxID=504805 RepID=A0A1G7W317_9ACTN|nr:hypothetical protein [Sinosporangium album]SDG66353.1 ABC-2 type transport system permease protein [Sinosporangium album]